MQTDPAKFKFDITYGYIRLRAWFDPGPNNTLIGMSAKDEFDRDGKLLQRGTGKPTGVIVHC